MNTSFFMIFTKHSNPRTRFCDYFTFRLDQAIDGISEQFPALDLPGLPQLLWHWIPHPRFESHVRRTSLDQLSKSQITEGV